MKTPQLPILPPVKYNADASTLNNTPRHFIGLKVGTVTVLNEIKRTRQYEYAAWSTDMVADAGTYDVVVGIDPYNHVNPLGFYAELQATITHDNCAPHFGGVAFAPASQARVGTRDKFRLKIPPLAALHMNRSRFTDRADYKLDLDLDTPQGIAVVETILIQSQQKQAQCEQFLNNSLAERDFGMVAHYAKAIDQEVSARRAALYTMNGNNEPSARVYKTACQS